MSKMDSVVHFEMPYDDRERMAKFYRDAFGWQTRMLGQEMGNYVIATTSLAPTLALAKQRQKRPSLGCSARPPALRPASGPDHQFRQVAR